MSPLAGVAAANIPEGCTTDDGCKRRYSTLPGHVLRAGHLRLVPGSQAEHSASAHAPSAPEIIALSARLDDGGPGMGALLARVVENAAILGGSNTGSWAIQDADNRKSRRAPPARAFPTSTPTSRSSFRRRLRMRSTSAASTTPTRSTLRSSSACTRPGPRCTSNARAACCCLRRS